MTSFPTKAEILDWIRDNPERAGKREIARAFGIRGPDRVALKEVLRDLEAEGQISGRRKRTRPRGHLPPVTVLIAEGPDPDGDIFATPKDWDGAEAPPSILYVPRRADPALGRGDRFLAKLHPVEDPERLRYEARLIKKIGAGARRLLGIYRAGAEGGDPAAQMTLGLLHRLGAGVPRDTGRMVALMREAADAGYHFAQFRLGQTYLTGEGVPGGQDAALGIPDREAAARYLSMAAEQGNIEAVLELARLYGDGDGSGGDPAQQLRWTERAAEAGLPDAIAALGFLYERGRGAEADPERAARLYVEALETGDVSMNDLRGQVGGYTPPWDRDTAITFQRILQERGLYAGAIDGIIGPMSRAAARALDD